jgi:ABC-type transport system involved in multi-copper enzyme maturation permease subunit
MKSTLSALQWLIRDTFRQALASGIIWFMIAVSLICVGLCLTATVSEPGSFSSAQTGSIPSGRMELGMGLLKLPIETDQTQTVHNLELVLVGWVADAVGLLLTLIWTAGFLPGFLDPTAASVLLAKPVSRTALLLGKVLGVVVVVAAQLGFFLAATWLAIGIRFGVWDTAYLLCLPLLVLNFSIFFGFSAMLATATRSVVVCIFGSILFWLICWSINVGRQLTHLLRDARDLTQSLSGLLDWSYWFLPKPLDVHFMLQSNLGADPLLGTVLSLSALQNEGLWHPGLSLATSATFGLLLFILVVYDFHTADY